MADHENAESSGSEGSTAVAEKESDFQYQIKVEDAGPATKKISIEIPEDRIKTKLAEQLKDLRRDVAIPGFRVGHAPVKLIEKRFGSDLKEQVRRSLVSESYEQAVEKNNLQVLGEPHFENPAGLNLPDNGPLVYTFEVEVQPEITLPNLAGIAVTKPKIQVKDENVDQAMSNLREQQGALIPVEDRGIEEKDYLTADVHLKLDGNVVAHQHDAQLVARPARLGGIEVKDFATHLNGAKAGETRTFTSKAPDDHPTEAIRGKDISIDVTVKDIKRLELAEITPEFLADLGFENEKEIREALREQMVERIDYDIAQAMRDQVSKYLLDNTTFELPTKMSARHVDSIVQRKAMDMMMRGVLREQIATQIPHLRAAAQTDAVRELKLFFILQKIATDQGTEVNESELNGRIAQLAAQRGDRPEKLKQEMSKDGSLSNLYVQMREQKALDKVLETAQIEEVEVAPDAEKKD